MPNRRRRSFTPQFKAQVVLEVLSGQRSAAESGRQHKLKPELISRWKDIALEGLEGLFHGDDQRGRDQERTAELERMVGRLTMELEVAKKLGRQTQLDCPGFPSIPACFRSWSGLKGGRFREKNRCICGRPQTGPVEFAILEKKPRPCSPRPCGETAGRRDARGRVLGPADLSRDRLAPQQRLPRRRPGRR